MKDLCNKYGIFILSGTQLSGDYRNDEGSGSKRTCFAVPSLSLTIIDLGMILLTVTDDDLAKLEPILSTGRFKTPNIKMSVYKNRRGRYKGVYLWCDADLGTCRVQPMFCTTYRYEMQSIEDIKNYC